MKKWGFYSEYNGQVSALTEEKAKDKIKKKLIEEIKETEIVVWEEE